MKATTGSVPVDGALLRYRRAGRPGAPVLVLLHGVTDGGAVWARVADELVDRFDMVMPDARGHGESSRTPDGIAIPVLARDAASLIEQLDLSPALVWGHSMGAATAAMLAATRPELVRAVVLEDPPFVEGELALSEDDDPRGSEFRELIESMAALTADERRSVAAEANPDWHPAEHGPWAETKAQFDLTALSLLADGLGIDWRDTVAGMTCPALVITGDTELGALVTPEVAGEIDQMLGSGGVVTIADAGHNVHRDRFAETLAAASEFLDRHGALGD